MGEEREGEPLGRKEQQIERHRDEFGLLAVGPCLALCFDTS